MAIYWKYLKIQMNSWSADRLVYKINILKKFSIVNIPFLKCQMYIYSFILVRTCPFANFVRWKDIVLTNEQ